MVIWTGWAGVSGGRRTRGVRHHTTPDLRERGIRGDRVSLSLKKKRGMTTQTGMTAPRVTGIEMRAVTHDRPQTEPRFILDHQDRWLRQWRMDKYGTQTFDP